MIDLVESVKLVGGIAGLGTAVFTIYDRLLKSRPVISICAAESFDVGQAYLRIKNRSDFDIALRSVESNSPAKVLFYGDTRTIVQHALGMEQHRAIAPGDTVHLPIHLPHDLTESLRLSGENLSFSVEWHRAGGLTWLQGWRLKASIRASDLHQMLDDASRRKVPRPNDDP